MTMTIYAIADLHLSSGDKPMDVFGERWHNHFERIEADWRARVKPEDTVLLPGDLSWAMQLPDALPHLAAVGALPGRKILIKGNHDFWWGSISRLREALPTGVYALQHDALLLSDTLFCGTRGWLLPGEGMAAEDLRVYERECLRLEMSLKAARALSADLPIVCLMHFPPRSVSQPETGFTRLLEAYGVRHAVYGHLHGTALRTAVTGEINGVTYSVVSCDGLGFALKQIE